MSIEDQILALMGRPDYTPATLEELARQLGGKHLARGVRKAIPRLMSAGTVAKVKKNCFCLPSDADLASGTIQFRQSGAARLLPDPTPENPTPTPVNIRAEDTGIALHGDKVLVRIFDGEDAADADDAPPFQRRRRRRDTSSGQRKHGGGATRAPGADWRHGRVIRILERAFDALPGTLKKTRLFWYIIPDDPRIGRDIIVGDPAKTALFPVPREDDKVVVRILEWKQRHLSPVGEIIEHLGRTHTPLAEYKAILYKYHLAADFPADAAHEAAAFPDSVAPRDLRHRRDLREVFTLTIDPDDAKDFDDALSLETLPDGTHRVGIHIADVSHYVRPGTPIDREARARGNSTYLVGTVLPMLPHALSSGLCSLVEGQDRLTKSVFITYDADNRHPVGAPVFANTVIRSRKRLTYTQALALLREDDLGAIRALPAPPPHQTGHPGRPLAGLDDAELREIQRGLRILWDIAAVARKKRLKAGALDLESPEIKIYCDPDGYAERAVRNTTDPSHQLIEEFMLAANEAVARVLADARLPNLSRVHEDPDPQKLADLRQQLLAAGIKTGDLTKRAEVQKLLATLNASEDTYPLRIAFLRSMRQACYRATADGHYGLAKKHYTHFTSPIRRYADLVEHRILGHYLRKSGVETEGGRSARADLTRPEQAPAPAPLPSLSDLATLAAHLSRTERTSADAERETVKIKLLELFERELAKPPGQRPAHDAIIVEVRNHGLYVELTDSQAYGLVHISTLTDDLYHINGDATALVGRKTRRTHTLGQHVAVTVDRIDRFKRQTDFRLSPGPNPAKPASPPIPKASPPITKASPPIPKNTTRATRNQGPAPSASPDAAQAGRNRPKKEGRQRHPRGAKRDKRH
ncbi:MAG: RNB domain-containing ribonuclease [Puniceicoccales bacterium]|jgi:ribonuclease R|nr:RNB domain-containing ribonuclease [Puniceicoccales bacterium]